MTVAFDSDAGVWAEPTRLAKPQGYPVVGLLPKIRANPLRFLVETALEFGDAVDLDLGLNNVLMLNRPDYIKHVAQDNHRNYHKSKFYAPLKPILGDGMFLAEGDFWIAQRQTAAKAFQGAELRRMVGDMAEATGDMIARWREQAHLGRPVEVCAEMSQLTLDIALRALFNVHLGNRQTKIYDALTVLLREAEKRVWSPIGLPKWLPTRVNRECAQALRDLDDFVHAIIDERKASGERRNDLLQILIDAYDDPTRLGVPANLLRDQVLSMILAGHETSANALGWAWYLLSKHPDIARAAATEVSTVLDGRAPQFEDLMRLKFVKMIFDETIRLYPPVWTLSRTAQADDRIGDMEIKKGTNVMLCAYAVHRRPQFWPNPEGFDPDRFDPKYAPVRRYAYFPFGCGARSCLGERFGTFESMVIMAMVLQSFRLSLVPGQTIEPEPMITLRPRGGVLMSLSPT